MRWAGGTRALGKLVGGEGARSLQVPLQGRSDAGLRLMSHLRPFPSCLCLLCWEPLWLGSHDPVFAATALQKAKE